MHDSGALRRGVASAYLDFHVIARSEATKQSILSLRGTMDCFASLAMTVYFGFSKIEYERAPHPQPSSPAKAGDPALQDISDGNEKLRLTGYSAFAEYDDLCEAAPSPSLR
jgi:hypothetical protein